MIKMSKQMKKITSIGILATTAATSIAPCYAYAVEQNQDIQSIEISSKKLEKAPLKMAIVADLHIFPKEYIGNEGPNYQAYVNGDRKMLKESTAILDATIERLKNSDADIILVAGDLTKDSEVLGHEIVEKKLMELEKVGKKVFITNGNHDINAPDAEKFEAVSGNVSDENREDKVVKIDGIKADEFEKLYKNLGFNESSTIANDPNSTSYVAKLADGYRLIAMDTNTYGQNKEDQRTSGHLENGRLEWILDQVKKAKAAGDTIIGISHHGIVEHFDGQGTVFAPYLVKNYEEISTQLADAGMEFVFTGHFHAQDVSIKTTNVGNTIMDVMTGSTVSYPSPIRFVEIDGDANKIDIKSERIKSIDDILEFEQYSEDTMRAGVPGMVSSLLGGILTDIVESMFTSRQEESKESRIINDYINEVINEEIKKLEESGEIEEGQNYAIEDIFTKDRLIKYINAVCDSLKDVTISTSIAPQGQEYKFMDAITHCLMEVYKGDENYSDDMKTLKKELENNGLIKEALVKVLVANKSQLYTGNIGDRILIDTVLSEGVLNGLFDTEISEDKTTLDQVLGGTFASLLDRVLNDDTPDNNVIYIDGKIPSQSQIENKLKEIEESIDRSKYTTSTLAILDKAILDAKNILANSSATEAQIVDVMSRLYKSVNNLELKSTDEGNNGNNNSGGSGGIYPTTILKDIDKHWAKDAINRFVDKGYIGGYEDSTFKPENAITRAEFVKVVNRVMGYSEKMDVKFTDVKSNMWYYNDIKIGVKAGYIDGYEDNTFKPNQVITREEAAKIVAKVTGLKGDGVLGFKDSNNVSSWAKDYVDALSDNKLIAGYEDNTFRPKNNITRAESVVMLDRIK